MERKLLLVLRITLYTHSLYWFINDNCIVDILPDECFACYRLAPDNSKCMNGMFQLLLRIDIDCFRFKFLFLLFSSLLPIWVSIRVHISLAFVDLIICHLASNYSCILVWNSDPHACRLIKTCSFSQQTKLVSK